MKAKYKIGDVVRAYLTTALTRNQQCARLRTLQTTVVGYVHTNRCMSLTSVPKSCLVPAATALRFSKTILLNY